ncbi:hypothetical protein SSP24_62590 [Streptomyces spinoverrucosus]|uniref:Uncharacterized protein n=1 Tax=Streptomyces spinoverrucosus TaxID=284043 RepID=A0A4Y3VNU3_9ACTN|nr:hypothetical protein [Streptomyces spinoverrucosus]GEC08604.1 hypothetical protein SSP24_62590 [Streptomyces spinoverrucosus]GHB68887.1 hypothetical protein GCM10010397_44020 [Streptomyces spinoverrucosus]
MERIGSALLTGFGLVWWLAGTSAVGEPLWPVAALAGCALAAGVWRTGRGRGKPGTAPPPDVRRRFVWVNALQWLAIAVVAFGASKAGVPELIPALVAVVVGVHFLPLATLFGQRRFHLTGALLVVAGVAGAAIGLVGAPASAVQMTVGFAAAIILWGTASLGLPEMGQDTDRPEAEPTGTP